MPKLNLEPNLSDPDGFYALLTDTHRGCDDAQSERINVKLVLLLANHIGDVEVLAEAMRIARGEEQGQRP
jgi:hypothetical protein